VIDLEAERSAKLLEAQAKAERLFADVDARGLVRAGVTEKALSDAIHALAADAFGVTAHWHKRIVRAGKNTLVPYATDPPDRTIDADDIVFLDFGPIFEAWEADFGRTFVIGSDTRKLKLRGDVGEAFARGKRYFRERPDITGSELFRYVVGLAEEYGWEFGGAMAGHLVGRFPHERIAGDKVALYIHPENDTPLRSHDAKGLRRHWILEIHFVDRARGIGGFYEELLTL
jgi:Xaa-Pro aminopeptidase